MNKNKIPYIIGASSLALILLFIIQVKWMDQSRHLIEEQFDQKVNMALCRAVDEAVTGAEKNEAFLSCKSSTEDEDLDCSDHIASLFSSINMQDQVSKSLSFYKIDMPFELSVEETSVELHDSECKPYAAKAYTCSLNPIIDSDEMELNINFIGKKAYVLEKMGLMLTLSILILLFITGVFIYANYYLIKQKKLSERNKEFFNHMAHEFKTPLTNIGLASKMMMKKSDDPLLNIIQSENQQLTTQVNSVLSMASVESGQFEIEKENINLAKLIDTVVASMEIQILEKKGSIEIIGIEEEAQILADPFHLSNVFKNLLENAVKYNDNVPKIQILGEVIGQNILISIQDNGVGIPPEEQELIFEKFYRIQKPHNYQNKGFGLGLSYVKKIINLHNGNIEIFSEWKKGTRFDLLFPKAI